MWCQLQSLFMFLSLRMFFNQLFPGRVLSRVMEIFGSISVWVSSLSAHSKAGSGWALWGLWARGARSSLAARRGRQTPLWPVGTGHLPSDLAWWPAGRSFVSSGSSGLRLVDNGAVSRLRGAGLPQCSPAGRHCKRGKWGQSRRFLCPAEHWPEVHLRGLGVKELHVQNGGFLVRFLYDLEDGQWCSLV